MMLFTVQSLKGLVSASTSHLYETTRTYLCSVPLVHKLESLIQAQSELPVVRDNGCWKDLDLTNLRGKCHKIANFLEMRTIEGAQKWHNHQILAILRNLNNQFMWSFFGVLSF